MINILRYIAFLLILTISLLSIVPMCCIRPVSTKNNRLFFKIFYPLCAFLLRVRIHIENPERIQQSSPSVVISNHQHNFDLLPLSKIFTAQMAVLGKKQLGFLPLFGQLFYLSGNILVDRSNRKKAMNSMKKIEEEIKENSLSIFIFPEGHRNSKNELLSFKKGAFYTAIKSQVPIVPIAVSQYSNHLSSKKWPMGEIYIKVLDPIETKGMERKEIPELMEKTRELLGREIQNLNKKYLN